MNVEEREVPFTRLVLMFILYDRTVPFVSSNAP